MYTQENLIKNIYGFKGATQIEGLRVTYDTEGYMGGQHRVNVSIDNTLGTIEITFAPCHFWGYVNPLGECKLNGKTIKTDSLFKYTYSKETCALRCIVDALIKL